MQLLGGENDVVKGIREGVQPEHGSELLLIKLLVGPGGLAYKLIFTSDRSKWGNLVVRFPLSLDMSRGQ